MVRNVLLVTLMLFLQSEKFLEVINHLTVQSLILTALSVKIICWTLGFQVLLTPGVMVGNSEVSLDKD